MANPNNVDKIKKKRAKIQRKVELLKKRDINDNQGKCINLGYRQLPRRHQTG
jgi:hypothetical protein